MRSAANRPSPEEDVGGGGFHGGAFGGGSRGGFDAGDFAREPSSFGRGGFDDRGADAGFGGGGYGSIHEAGEYADHTEIYRSRLPSVDQAAETTHAANAATTHTANAATTHAANAARTDWDNYSRTWNGYYGGLAYDRGLAIGTAVAAVPAGAYALSYLGTNYWYASGAWYEAQANAYVVVPPIEGAVVPAPPPSCSSTELSSGVTYVCDGAYYQQVPNGYQVVPPPIGETVRALPPGALHKTIKGVSYYTAGRAWYRPTYVSYKVVREPA